MAYTSRVLVVARQTAGSDDLRDALVQRAERGPVSITLLMPARAAGLEAKAATRPDLDAALAKLREAGLEADGVVGDFIPLEGVAELWEPGKFDEIIVSTLPGATSKWMLQDFPHRLARMCDVPVSHVVSRLDDERTPRTGPAPQHERPALGPLAVLGWGGKTA